MDIFPFSPPHTQLHGKLAKNISNFLIHCTEKDGQIFYKESEEAAGR